MLKLVHSAAPPPAARSNSTKRRVLMVDDELPILLTMKRRLRDDYEIESALSADDALARLEQDGPFDVIVSDMRMPGCDGVEFLSKAKDVAPAASRIMLTGDTERSTAVSAMNRGQVFRFLEKPCDAKTLSDAIAAAIEDGDRRGAPEQIASQMLGSVQHEFRTPLHHILGFANMIAEGTVPPSSAKEYAGYILESGRELLDVSETILALTSIQSGRYRPDFQEVNLRSLIRQAVKPHRQLAAAKGLEIFVDTGERSIDIVADKDLITRALKAAVSNAVKFSNTSSVVTVTVDLSDQDVVFLDVSDEGPGIPQDKIASVCEPFIQADMSLSRSHDGFGLGLPIASAAAQVHSGRLEIHTEVDTGTTLRFVLPREPANTLQ